MDAKSFFYISPPSLSLSPQVRFIPPNDHSFWRKQIGFTPIPFSYVLPPHKIFAFIGTNFSFISSCSFSSKSPGFPLQNETATLGSSEHETQKTGFQSLTKYNILSFHSFDKWTNSFVFIYASPWQRDTSIDFVNWLCCNIFLVKRVTKHNLHNIPASILLSAGQARDPNTWCSDTYHYCWCSCKQLKNNYINAFCRFSHIWRRVYVTGDSNFLFPLHPHSLLILYIRVTTYH